MKVRIENRVKRRKAITHRIKASGQTIRLALFRSSAHIYGYIIDDTQEKTLFGVSDRSIDAKMKLTKTQKAYEVGKALAQKAQEAGIKKVAFDRSGFLYHGRVKSLADGAREGGLEF